MSSGGCSNAPLVEMRGISKRFPGTVANDHVHLTVEAGEVHALLGENGAGKTTLMCILAGLYRPDEGEIFLRGRRLRPGSPRDAIRAGIGMVHQHFRLVDVFTVAENITLGLERPRWWLNRARLGAEVAELGRRYGLPVNPEARIWQLSVGEQQRVEILKTLYRGVEVLILDEPTAVLTPQEAGELFAAMRHMAASGRAIVFITHKLREVMEVADRITVLRAGQNVATVRRAETDLRRLAHLMVGEEVSSTAGERVPRSYGEPLLELLDVRARGDRGLPALRGVSLVVRAGEIVGLAGVSGNGQRELAEAVAGLRRIDVGRIRVAGQEVTGLPPDRIMAAGLSLIPEDRLGVGLVPVLGVSENVILKSYRYPPLCRGGWLRWGEARRQARELMKAFSIRVPSLETPVSRLSGGNQQRLLLAREITARPRVLVAVHPTRGLDVAATAAVHQLLLKQRDGGTAILLISEDLDEILALSDRVAVIYEGTIVGEVSPPQEAAIRDQIGFLMGGAEPAAAGAAVGHEVGRRGVGACG